MSRSLPLFLPKTSLFLCPMFLTATACNWVDSTGRQGNEIPQINIVVDGESLSTDRAFALTESESRSIDLSGSTDTDGEIVEYYNELVDEGKIELCSALIDMAAAANHIADACESQLIDESCSLSIISAADSNDDQNAGLSSGVFTLIAPELDAPVGLTYRWTIVDNDGGEASTDVTFCLNTRNEIPVAVEDYYQIPYNSTLDIPVIDYADDCSIRSGTESVLGNDLEGNNTDSDCLRAELLSLPQFASNDFTADFDERGGFRYTHSGLSDSNTDSFTYRAVEGEFFSEPVNVTLTIDFGYNQEPLANDDVFQVGINSLDNKLYLTANDDDPEGYPLTITGITAAPDQGGTAKITGDGYILYTPPADYTGIESLQYSISDAGGKSDSATASIFVSAENSPPVAVDDDYTAEAGDWTLLSVLDNDYDIDGDYLQIVDTGVPDRGARVVINTDKTAVFYRARSKTRGKESFGYTIEDSDGDRSSATVTVNVVNDD